MEVDTVLVAIDATQGSLRAIEAAVVVADRYEAGVHALYVLDRETIDQGDAAAADREAALAIGVSAVAARAGVTVAHSTASGFSTSSLRHHPGSVVLDAAADVGADLLVMPREDAAAVLGKTAEYVVQYADEPVLSV